MKSLSLSLSLFRPNIVNISKPLNFLKLVRKNIYYNPKAGYYAPETTEDTIGEVKTWLTSTNPQLLCIYFTNDWNPICKQGEVGYKDFVAKNAKVTHLKVNADKHPQLRWFFDAKLEPCMRLYYHGTPMKVIGGCNFQKFEKHINRTFEYVNKIYNPSGNYNKDYELPYYKWEADLDQNGTEMQLESSASWIFPGFRGQYTLREAPDEQYITHERMKK